MTAWESSLDIGRGGAYTKGVHGSYEWVVGGLAAVFIGVSKAGFGGGLGMLTTPLCVMAFGPRDAIGILLPMLCAGDAFSLYHYWGKWQIRNVWYLMPGVLAGVVLGTQLIGRFSARELNLAIGVLAVSFVLFQWVKERIYRAEGALVPNYRLGLLFGIGSGVTSTFAHGAGPVVSMFLIPQRLPKEIYVGTTVLVFTWINWIKMPFFIGTGLVTVSTMTKSLLFLPLIPVGVWLGVWCNRRLSEQVFLVVIYAITLVTGLQLMFQWDWAGLFR